MRNLKRVLSLTLASVMLLGMMVVGSNAAAGYDDVSKDDNVEAIEVLQAIEVMVGDERGFGPERPVNRAEMAVVMGKLLNLDYNYYTALCPFTDVYDWAQGWVGACYANKIVSGRGDGIYDPSATVTAVEAASMLMRALGYFQYQNDYAAGFELATVTQGKKIGIFDNVGSSASEPMTRNQVAQMVLNALQSDTVEPDGNTINLTTPDGSVLTGKVNYVSVTRDEAFATAIKRTQASSVGSQNDGYIVELGERLYNGDLKLYEYTDDIYMRPSRTWEYDGKEIGTYMKKENIRAEYTAGVTMRELYNLLGRTILENYEFSYYVDGVLADDTANAILSRQDNTYTGTVNGTSWGTGRGVLTQVFVDVKTETIDITSINTYLAKATMDYNSTTESVTLNIYGYAYESGTSPDEVVDTFNTVKPVSLADVEAIKDVKQDEYVLVNISGKNYAGSHNPETLTNYDVADVADVEIMSDSTLTKFSKRGSSSDTHSDSNEALFDSVVSGGTEYKSSARAYYSDDVLELYDDDRLVNKTYNIYLDKYGYAIGIDLHEGNDNYVFITGFDPSGSNIAYGNATAAAIFTDGTQDVIKVDVKATNINIDKVDNIVDPVSGNGSYFEKWGGENSMNAYLFALNRWYTYTVDANGIYTLHPATRMITTEVVDNPATEADDTIIKTASVRIDENASKAGDSGANKAGRIGDGKNGIAAFNSGTRVYGNDDSVYIVVETGDTEFVDNSTGVGTVITDVTGVYTGVQNAEIKVTGTTTAGTLIPDGARSTALYDSIYTVYDKNNYIIASVVLGEAKGGNANYAYILTAAKSEERLTDGSTIWEFDAIVDGKIVTLKTNSKFSSVISGLQPGHIQELRYSGDYVSGVKTPTKAEQYYDYEKAVSAAKIDDEEIYDVGHSRFSASWNCQYGTHTNTDASGAANYVDGASSWDSTGAMSYTGPLTTNHANNLKMIGNTMYFRETTEIIGGHEYAKDNGLAIKNGAPAVVIHRVDGDWEHIEYPSVPAAIAALADPITNAGNNNKEFQGRIVAVLDDQGAAKWVVFISLTEVTTASGGTAIGSNNQVGAISGSNINYNIPANSNNPNPNIDNILNDIVKQLGWNWNSSRGDSIQQTGTDTYNIRYDGKVYTVNVTRSGSGQGSSSGTGRVTSVTVDTTSENGYGTAWDVTGMVVEGSVTNADKINAIVKQVEKQENGVTYTGRYTVDVDGKTIILEFTDGFITYKVNFDSTLTPAAQAPSNATSSQVQDLLDNNDEVVIAGNATFSGNVDPGKEVTVEEGGTLTLTSGANIQGIITGEGDVKITGAVTSANNIQVDGDIILGAGGSLTTTDGEPVGVSGKPANVVLDGTGINNTLTVHGDVITSEEKARKIRRGVVN